MIIVDNDGNLFNDRRKGDRRKKQVPVENDQRKAQRRTNTKNKKHEEDK